MSEFDEVVTIRRIVGLYRERGMERTADDIRSYAKSIAKRSSCKLEDAYESIESDLLSNPPNPEKWDSDE